MNDFDEDDDYDNDDYHDYDHPSLNPYQYHFSFDFSGETGLSQWIIDMLSNIGWTSSSDANPFAPENVLGFSTYKFPVNSWNPNTADPKKSQYLGSNYYGQEIWKTKYFVCHPVDMQYKNHLQSNAAHFVQQPSFYRGLFDILN